jgi:hypothetical protein
MSPPWLA